MCAKLDPTIEPNLTATSVVEARALNPNADVPRTMRRLGHDTASVLRHAAEGKLEEWVHSYLAEEGWANPGLSEGLKKQKRWWNGPLQMDCEKLRRVVGPEPHMEYHRDDEGWSRDLRALADSVGDPLTIPPLIAEYREGESDMRLADGNTRYGAMTLLGWPTCWVIIWYNREEDFVRHSEQLGLSSESS